MAHTFPFGKEQLVISDQLADYNELRHSFAPLADRAEAKFRELYEKQNHDLKSLIRNCPDQIYESLNIVIDHCIRMMMQNGIYDIDNELFLNKCTPYVTVVNRFNDYLHKYESINGNLNSAREYRDYRKASRGMFVGGGFGVGGALKGAATAGALNMTSGLFHSIANGIGNMFDEASANYEMDTIFKDPLTLCDLANSVWESAFNMHYAYIDILENRKDITIPRFNNNNIRSAEAIFENLCRMDLPFEQAQKPLCELFSLQPYEYKYYQYVILKYGDANNQLQKIGEFFHINMSEMKMHLLQTAISGLNYDTLDSDINSVIKGIEDVALNFGMSTEIIKPIGSRIRSSFFAYHFKEGLDKTTGIYLPDRSQQRDFQNIYQQYKTTVRQSVSEIYQRLWNASTAGNLLLGPEHINHMKDSYHDYLLLLSTNSEHTDFLFSLSESLFEYGRGRACRVSQITDIAVNNNILIINQNIIIPLSCNNVDEKQLETLLNEVISTIQTTDLTEFKEQLSVPLEPTPQEESILATVKKFVSVNAKTMKRYANAYNVFIPHDPEHLMVYHNICSKMNIQTQDDFVEFPIIFFKNKVTTSMVDDSYADSEYNKSLYKVTSDEYALFTGKSIVFTATGAILPISKINKVKIDKDEGTIYVTSNGENHIITNFYPEACAQLQQFITSLLSIYRGEDVLSNMAETQSVDAYMAEIYAKIMNYAGKRMNQKARNTIFSRILINCNNDTFDQVMEEFSDTYPELKEKEVLFLIQEDSDDSEIACFVTKQDISCIYAAQDDDLYYGFLSPNKTLPLENAAYFEEYFERGKYYGDDDTNSLVINYYKEADDPSLYFVPLFEFDDSVQRIAPDFISIVNMLLEYICEKEKIDRRYRKENPSSDSIIQKINDKFNSIRELNHTEKLIYVLNPGKREAIVESWLSKATKYYNGTDKPVVFMFNDALLTAGAHGAIITPKNLYYSIVIEKGIIPIKDILEIRPRGNRNILVITKDQEYELDFVSTADIDVPKLTIFMSELIFLLQEQGDLVEDDIRRIRQEQKDEQARRAQRGVYTYIQRHAVNSIKKYYELHPELHEGPSIYFNDGSTAFENQINALKQKFNVKIDNIEVPLIAIHSPGRENKEGFILTNEKWHHMIDGSSVYTLGHKYITATGWKDASIISEEYEIILLKHDTYPSYPACKIKSEKRGAFESFFKLIINSLDELSGKITLSEQELQEKQAQLKQLIEGYQNKNSHELKALLANIAENYPFDFASSVATEIEAQMNYNTDRELEAEMTKKCENLPNLDYQQIKDLEQDLQKYPSHLAKPFLSEVYGTKKLVINGLKQEIESLMQDYSSLNIEGIDELLEKVSTYPPECNESYIKQLSSHRDTLYEDKWDKKCANLDSLNLEETNDLLQELELEKINNRLKDIFRIILLERQETIYVKQLNELISDYESKTVDELEEIIKAFTAYPKHLTTDYERRITEQIHGLHTALFESWCNEAAKHDYLYAEKIRNDIIHSSAPDDIKKQYVLKAAGIVEQLYIQKHNNLYSLVDNMVTQRNLSGCALNTRMQGNANAALKLAIHDAFPQYHYWEEPLVSHYVSKLLGNTGYAFTPEKFYLLGASNVAYEINNIAAFKTIKKLMGIDIVLQTTTGISVNLGSKHGKNVEIIADTLNQILSQLRSSQYIYCANCGTRLSVDTKFCSSCGTPTQK